VTAPPWRATAFVGKGTHGPAHVRIEPEQLTIYFVIERLLRVLLRRWPEPTIIRADAVRALTDRTWRGRHLCEIADDTTNAWNSGPLVEWQVVRDWALMSPKIQQLLGAQEC